jgi:hypothetical protein
MIEYVPLGTLNSSVLIPRLELNARDEALSNLGSYLFVF